MSQADSELKTFFGQKRVELSRRFHHPNNLSRRFILEEDIQNVWSRDLGQIFERRHESFRKNVAEKYLITLSILVFIRFPVTAEHFPAMFQRHDIHDAHLPLDKSEIPKDLPDNYREDFWEHQFIFTPFIIRRPSKAGIDIMQENQRFPFLGKPKRAGSGAFGEVWQASVAKRGYRDDRIRNMGNLDEMVIAYKKIPSSEGFLKEVQALDYLRESLVHHEHIAVHLAAVSQGDSNFYIFFELSELGDLEVLFNGGLEKYTFSKEFPKPRKVMFIEELMNVAGALDYLHNQLQHRTKVYCAHMDLKPDNILVHKRRNGDGGVGKWVLTDFGISSFKVDDQAREPIRSGIPTIGDIARRTPTSTSVTRILEGAHRAPELHHQAPAAVKRNLAGRRCDVWSFACIAHEVLAFLVGNLGCEDAEVERATQSLRNFRQCRDINSDESWFEYTNLDDRTASSAGQPHPIGARMKSAIESWYSKILSKVVRESPREHEWVSQYIGLLRALFQINPDDRLTAGEIIPRLHLVRKSLDKALQEQTFGPKQLGPRQTSIVPGQASGREINSQNPTDNHDHAFDHQAETRLSRPPSFYVTPSATTRSRSDGTVTPVESETSSPVGPQASPTNPVRALEPARSNITRTRSASLRSAHLLGRNVTFDTAQRGTVVLSCDSNDPRLESQNIQQQMIDTESLERRPVMDESRTIDPSHSDSNIQSLPTPNLSKVPLGSRKFKAPADVNDFDLSQDGTKAVFLYKESQKWKVCLADLTSEALFPQPLPVEIPTDAQWHGPDQRPLVLSSSYLVITASIGKSPRHWLYNLDTNTQIEKAQWHRSTSRITPSSTGAFAWIEHKPRIWIVRYWNSRNNANFSRQLEEDITDLCFNGTGEYLFVWTRRGGHHYIYTIDVESHPEPIRPATFPTSSRPSNEVFVGSQSKAICLAQDHPAAPRYHIQSSVAQVITDGPTTESSITAICDNYVAIAYSRRSFKTSLTLITKQFHVSATTVRPGSVPEGRLIRDDIKVPLRSKSKLAVTEYADGTGRIVLCTSKGHDVWLEVFATDAASGSLT